MADLTEAQIREILAGCEGVTPGPWFCGCWSGRCHKQHRHTGPVGDDPCIYEPEKFDAYRAGGIGAKEGRQVLSSSSDGIEISMADARHVARLDPATVAALCNMALDRAAAEASLAKANATIERLTAEGLYISEQFSGAAGDIVKLRAQIAELEAALIAARWYVETYDTRSQNPEQDSALTAIDAALTNIEKERDDDR